jgi:hypothetical protein
LVGEFVEAGGEVGGGGHFVVGADDGACGDLDEVKFGFAAGPDGQLGLAVGGGPDDLGR